MTVPVPNHTASAGRAIPLTVLTPLRPGWTLWLRTLFAVLPRLTRSRDKLDKLSFIQAARWTIITGLPQNGPDQRPENLRYDYLFFESNYNGGFDPYIDAFSLVMPWRMRAIWGSSYGFPGPRPTGPFKQYIRRNDLDTQFYYSAYPDASATEVKAALTVDAALPALAEAAVDPDLTDEQFRLRYVAALTALQEHL